MGPRRGITGAGLKSLKSTLSAKNPNSDDDDEDLKSALPDDFL